MAQWGMSVADKSYRQVQVDDEPAQPEQNEDDDEQYDVSSTHGQQASVIGTHLSMPQSTPGWEDDTRSDFTVPPDLRPHSNFRGCDGDALSSISVRQGGSQVDNDGAASVATSGSKGSHSEGPRIASAQSDSDDDSISETECSMLEPGGVHKPARVQQRQQQHHRPPQPRQRKGGRDSWADSWAFKVALFVSTFVTTLTGAALFYLVVLPPPEQDAFQDLSNSAMALERRDANMSAALEPLAGVASSLPPPSPAARPCSELRETKTDLRALDPPQWCNDDAHRRQDPDACHMAYVSLPVGPLLACEYQESAGVCAESAQMVYSCGDFVAPSPAPQVSATPTRDSSDDSLDDSSDESLDDSSDDVLDDVSDDQSLDDISDDSSDNLRQTLR